MDKVTPLAIHAVPFVHISPTHLSFVLRIELLVLAQLVGPMGEFTPLVVGTIPVLHELLTEL